MNKKNIFISLLSFVVIVLLTIYVLPWIIAIALVAYGVYKIRGYLIGRKQKDTFVDEKKFEDKDKIVEEVVDVDYKPL